MQNGNSPQAVHQRLSISSSSPPARAPMACCNSGPAPSKGFCDNNSQCEVSLREYINFDKVSALNADPKTYSRSILEGHGVLKSDPEVDQQLMLVVPFREAVKLKSVRFLCDSKDSDDESGPKDVHLFVDRPNFSFSDAESAVASQVLKLTPANLSLGASIPLKFLKFQNVHSLTVFISSNQTDSEITCLNELELFGFPIAGTNMNELRKSG